MRFVKKTHFFCIFFSKKFAHIKKKYYLCTRFQKGDHETPKRKPQKKETKMKTNLQEKTIQRIIAKMFWSEKKARKAVAEFWELAERSGCRTPKDFAEDITSFVCF